jgi:signal transduction histidine kinase
LRGLSKRNPLWLGFLAAAIPLVVLLILQYNWLIKLEDRSVEAYGAYLDRALEAVTTKVEDIYRSRSERTLSLPPTVFQDFDPEEIARHFKKRPIEGARKIFIVYFPREGGFKPMFYDPYQRAMVVPKLGADDSLTEMSSAIAAACAPLAVLRLQDTRLRTPTLASDERDPNNRVILQPITDEFSRLVGVTGYIVDNDYFRSQLLPAVVEKSLRRFFHDEADEMVVTARNPRGALVFASSAFNDTPGEDSVLRPFSFVYTDWRIGIRSLSTTPEQYARTTFHVNMGVSIALAIVLLGGIALAFRAALRELKLSRMKGDFVSNVSHELRTPLASVRVFGEFLRLGRVKSPEKVREYGEYIETESRRLTQLINNILDFSKIESGVKTYNFEDADVREVVLDTLKTFDVRLKHTGFGIDLDGADQPLPLVRIDREAIRQALHNLLDNAVKYSGESKRIVVELATTDGFVTVSVRDFGVGISRDEQKKIFERFHRVSTGLVHDVKGSGLGLSIVSHIVRAHQGRITVESEPGKGSAFTIRLPASEDFEEIAEPDDTGEVDTEPRVEVQSRAN